MGGLSTYPSCIAEARVRTVEGGNVMRVLVVDVGGKSVKVRTTGQSTSQKFRSGPKMTPDRMVSDMADVVARLIDALQPDDVVLGGGNANKLKTLPTGCRLGDNANAFLEGMRLWEMEKPVTCRLSKTSLPEWNRKEKVLVYTHQAGASKPDRAAFTFRSTRRNSVGSSGWPK